MVSATVAVTVANVALLTFAHASISAQFSAEQAKAVARACSEDWYRSEPKSEPREESM